MREANSRATRRSATLSTCLLGALALASCSAEGPARSPFAPAFAAETECSAAYWPTLTSELEAACECELTLLVEPSGTFGESCLTQYIRVGEGQVLLGLDVLEGSPDDDPLAIYRGLDEVVAEPAIGDESVLLVFDDPVTGAATTLYVRYGNALLTLTTPRSAEATEDLLDELDVQALGTRWVEHLATLP